jgi:hypothetical protein
MVRLAGILFAAVASAVQEDFDDGDLVFLRSLNSNATNATVSKVTCSKDAHCDTNLPTFTADCAAQDTAALCKSVCCKAAVVSKVTCAKDHCETAQTFTADCAAQETAALCKSVCCKAEDSEYVKHTCPADGTCNPETEVPDEGQGCKLGGEIETKKEFTDAQRKDDCNSKCCKPKEQESFDGNCAVASCPESTPDKYPNCKAEKAEQCVAQCCYKKPEGAPTPCILEDLADGCGDGMVFSYCTYKSAKSECTKNACCMTSATLAPAPVVVVQDPVAVSPQALKTIATEEAALDALLFAVGPAVPSGPVNGTDDTESTATATTTALVIVEEVAEVKLTDIPAEQLETFATASALGFAADRFGDSAYLKLAQSCYGPVAMEYGMPNVQDASTTAKQKNLINAAAPDNKKHCHNVNRAESKISSSRRRTSVSYRRLNGETTLKLSFKSQMPKAQGLVVQKIAKAKNDGQDGAAVQDRLKKNMIAALEVVADLKTTDGVEVMDADAKQALATAKATIISSVNNATVAVTVEEVQEVKETSGGGGATSAAAAVSGILGLLMSMIVYSIM